MLASTVIINSSNPDHSDVRLLSISLSPSSSTPFTIGTFFCDGWWLGELAASQRADEALWLALHHVFPLLNSFQEDAMRRFCFLRFFPFGTMLLHLFIMADVAPYFASPLLALSMF